VVILASVLLAPGRLGVADVLPVRVHAVLDYVGAFFLILAPFMFGFADLDRALTASIFAGVAVLVMSLLTTYPVDLSREAGEGSPAT